MKYRAQNISISSKKRAAGELYGLGGISMIAAATGLFPDRTRKDRGVGGRAFRAQAWPLRKGVARSRLVWMSNNRARSAFAYDDRPIGLLPKPALEPAALKTHRDPRFFGGGNCRRALDLGPASAPHCGSAFCRRSPHWAADGGRACQEWARFFADRKERLLRPLCGLRRGLAGLATRRAFRQGFLFLPVLWMGSAIFFFGIGPWADSGFSNRLRAILLSATCSRTLGRGYRVVVVVSFSTASLDPSGSAGGRRCFGLFAGRASRLIVADGCRMDRGLGLRGTFHPGGLGDFSLHCRSSLPGM